MLEFENEMFLSALQEDGLTITAKGLGLEAVFLNLLKVSCPSSPPPHSLKRMTSKDEALHITRDPRDGRNEIELIPTSVKSSPIRVGIKKPTQKNPKKPT
jgi:hypothetical protein